MRRRAKPRLPEQASDLGAARTAAVGLLARRDFASTELRRKLEDEGFDHALAAEVVAELVEGGVLQDSRDRKSVV